jgi:hypothetical protein
MDALGDRCGQLQTIDVMGCEGITDMDVSVLIERFPSIDIRR